LTVVVSVCFRRAQRLTWTQSWRRKNKKGKIETAAKKKGKRSARVFKSIQGITIEDIKKRRDTKPDLKKAQRENALREVKERSKKAKVEKKKDTKAKKAAAPTSAFEKVPKSRRLAAKPKATTR
jgi:large subunit ribosomal protein L24e